MTATDDDLARTLARLTGRADVEIAGRERTAASVVVRARPGGAAPWFVKLCPPGASAPIAAAHAAEVDFYTRVLPQLGGQVAPPLVAATAAPQPIVVLEDLRASTETLPYPMPGRARHVRAALRALGRLHARGLGFEEERAAPAAGPDDVQPFLDEHEALLPPAVARRLRRAAEALRHEPPRALRRTVLQGDAHFANMLFPRTGEPALLCDWQHWRTGTPGHDLATLLGLHGRASAARPQPFLRFYAAGVTAWTLDELTDDYRRSVLRQAATVPAWQASIGLPATIWWPLLERGMRAWTGARCDELL